MSDNYELVILHAKKEWQGCCKEQLSASIRPTWSPRRIKQQLSKEHHAYQNDSETQQNRPKCESARNFVNVSQLSVSSPSVAVTWDDK